MNDAPSKCEVPGCNGAVDFVSPRYWCEKHWNLWMDYPVDHEGTPEPAWMALRAACYCCGEWHPPHYPDAPKGTVFLTVYEGSEEGACRAIVICSACFERGGFDMWTDEVEWDSKNPLVPYRLLPPYDHEDPERDDVSKYPSPHELLKSSREAP